MTIGSDQSIENFDHKMIPKHIEEIITFLNVYWGFAIIQKIKNSYKKD